MTDDLDDLAALADLLDQRVQIVRVIIDADGKELARIYRGSFQQPRGPQDGEPHTKESHHED